MILPSTWPRWRIGGTMSRQDTTTTPSSIQMMVARRETKWSFQVVAMTSSTWTTSCTYTWLTRDMTADGKCSDINIVFFHTNFVCAVEVSGGYQLDLRETRTASILRTSTLTSYRIQLLLEGLQVRFTSSQWTTMSAAPLMVKPKRAKYNRVYGDVISQIRVTVEDPVGRLVDLNGVAWYMTLLLQTRPEDSNIV